MSAATCSMRSLPTPPRTTAGPSASCGMAWRRRMSKEELEFFDTHSKPWRDVPGSKCAGLHERILTGDPTTGNYSRMLRFDPGCDTTPNGVLAHDFWEEVYIR